MPLAFHCRYCLVLPQNVVETNKRHSAFSRFLKKVSKNRPFFCNKVENQSCAFQNRQLLCKFTKKQRSKEFDSVGFGEYNQQCCTKAAKFTSWKLFGKGLNF